MAASQRPRPSLLILHWDDCDLEFTTRIREACPALAVTWFSLRTASKWLLQQSESAPAGVSPARYVFTELIRSPAHADLEFTQVSHNLKALLQQATILASYSLLPPSRDFVPSLEWIHLFSAGADLAINQPLVMNTDIAVTTSKGIHGIAIAEWVAMNVLAFRRNLRYAYKLQDEEKWPKNKERLSGLGTLQGRKVGIVGYGSIGRQVARILAAFGCSVVALVTSPNPDTESRRYRGYTVPGTGDNCGAIPAEWFGGTDRSTLHDFLSQELDFLVLTIPLTPTTERLLSGTEFDVLSQHPGVGGNRCFLINVSRGRVIDQAALIAALNDGRLAGAASDVTVPEPLPPGSPLWSAKNVTITPHISTKGPGFLACAADVLITNLRRWEQGDELLNLVNRLKGY